MSIPFTDLKTQYERLKPEIDRRIQAVLDHGQYIMGPEVRELEQTLAEYVGVKHAIGCSSGTDALLLPLMALGVGPGDAVFTTPFTFIATAEVISLLGATPVFVDIDPLTYNIDPTHLDRAIRALQDRNPSAYPLPKNFRDLTPRGVIAVDLYGLPADYDALQAVCDDHGLFLIEDAAQSFGGEYKGRKACAFGDAAATSFFPAKPLGCYGDGGMVFTNRDDLAEICRSLLVHGKGTDKYDNVRLGLNARLDTIQAAVVLAKFSVFPDELEKRQETATHYGTTLVRHSHISLPHVPAAIKPAWAQYTLTVATEEDRKETLTRLSAAQIPFAIYYPLPLHLQEAFKRLQYPPESFSISEKASKKVFSLPFGPYLNKKIVHRIASSLNLPLG